MNISYDYYRIFYFVAKYNNFTHAANVLMSNQPNVTRAVKNLEAALGCVLFNRSNRGVTLTHEGKKLYERVSIAFDQLEAGEEELTHDSSIQRKILTLGVTETALHGYLLPILSRYRKTHPEIRLRISSYTTPQAVSALRNGLVDFSIVTSATGITKPLIQKKLMTFDEVLVAGQEFEYLKGKHLTLSDLTTLPLISLTKESETFKLYSNIFAANGLTLRPDIEAATTDQILTLVKANLGIGFLPSIFAKESLSRNEIFAIDFDEKIPKRSISLIKNTNRPTSEAARNLENMLTETPK